MTVAPSGVERSRLFLVDGYALIYRAFFAMITRPLRTAKGENTSAAWGVANFLARLLDTHHPAYVAWVHDAGDSFRTARYPEYKSTREKLDEELSFTHEVQERTSHVKITCVRGDGVEPVRLLAEIKHLTDRALRMDFAGIRAGLKSLVPEFSQHADEPEMPVAVGGER